MLLPNWLFQEQFGHERFLTVVCPFLPGRVSIVKIFVVYTLQYLHLISCFLLFLLSLKMFVEHAVLILIALFTRVWFCFDLGVINDLFFAFEVFASMFENYFDCFLAAHFLVMGLVSRFKVEILERNRGLAG